MENSTGDCVIPTECPCLTLDNTEYKQGEVFVTTDTCEKWYVMWSSTLIYI